MYHRLLFPTLVCLAILSVPVVADDVPKPDGMSLIYQHDFEDSSMDRYEPQMPPHGNWVKQRAIISHHSFAKTASLSHRFGHLSIAV